MPRGDRKIATIFDSSASDDEGENANKGARQEFFVGGSSKSGQQVLGPLPNDENVDAMVRRVFEEAARHGGTMVNSDSVDSDSFRAFKGAGHSVKDHQESTNEPQNVKVKVELWSDCFTVDGGTPRPYEEPKNKEFLDQIAKGRIPRELIQAHGAVEIILDMKDRRNEKYKMPKMVPFSGRGIMLGSPTPHVSGAGTVGEKYASSSKVNTVISGPPEVPLDESKPAANIQVRFPDGSRLQLRMNLHRTVGDIRLMICSKKPEYCTRAFVLLAGFPAKEITNIQETIEEAHLANCAIMVRPIAE
uniref:NSFL1 cofactor p47 n=1 Tax=Trichuris muris TaxID=70415 RepID=A0A5S6R1M2_TRIMR